LEIGLIAMQKVVGSNPISRFDVNPLHLGRSALAAENQPPPHIASVWGLMPYVMPYTGF